MPRKAIDYSKTVIYKIEHIDDETLLYIGHTTNWDKRKCEHKHRCNSEKSDKHNLKLYQMIRENGGWEMFKMIEVEKYPCNDKREAEKKETEVMKELKSNMNMIKSYLTEEEKTTTRKKQISNIMEVIKQQYQKKEKHIGKTTSKKERKTIMIQTKSKYWINKD